jgi:hypothetical protein
MWATCPSICPRDRRLHRRTLCRGRSGKADPDDASVPRGRGGYLRCRGLPRCGRGRPQDGVGRRGLLGVLGLARGHSRLRWGERGHRTPQLRLAFGRAGDEGAAAPGTATTPGGGHLGDARVHPQADRGGRWQGRTPAAVRRNRAADRLEPGRGRLEHLRRAAGSPPLPATGGGSDLLRQRGEDPGQTVELRVERALRADDFPEGDSLDPVPAEPDHRPGGVLGERLDRRCSKTGGEYAVEGARAAAGLDVPEDCEVSLVGAPGLVDEVAELLRGGRGGLCSDDPLCGL